MRISISLFRLPVLDITADPCVLLRSWLLGHLRWEDSSHNLCRDPSRADDACAEDEALDGASYEVRDSLPGRPQLGLAFPDVMYAGHVSGLRVVKHALKCVSADEFPGDASKRRP